MTHWYVGQKIVCISSEWDDRGFPYVGPIEKQIYTIEHIESGESNSGVGFLLLELTNAPQWGFSGTERVFREPAFDSYGFRPLVETDISVFEKLLLKKPRKKSAPAPKQTVSA